MKKFCFAILLLLAGILTYRLYEKKLLFFQEVESFAYLEPAHYAGKVTFNNSDRGFVYIKSTLKPSLVFAFNRGGLNQKSIELPIAWTMLNSDSLGSKLPISFSSDFKNIFCSSSDLACMDSDIFYFTAKNIGNSNYSGVINYRLKKEEVKIAVVNFTEVDASRFYDKDISEHLKELVIEKEVVSTQLARVDISVSKLIKEKAELEKLLFNKSGAVKSVKDKFEAEVKKIKELKLELKKLELEKQSLNAKSSLMQKIQPYGKLVALSRESLKREASLIEKLAEKRYSNLKNKENQEKIDSRDRVKLQDLIFKEKQKILELKRMKAEYEKRNIS